MVSRVVQEAGINYSGGIGVRYYTNRHISAIPDIAGCPEWQELFLDGFREVSMARHRQ